MQNMHLDASASVTWQSCESCFRQKTCIDFKKFIEKALSHRDAAYEEEQHWQRRIHEKYSRAIFVHCAAHCLNLVINNQSRVPIVRSTCDIIRETIRFFRECPKRRSRLGVNIPLFSPTRWSEKYKSIRIFKANFKLIFDALASLMVGREQ